MTLVIPNAAVSGKKIIASKYNENNTAIADAVNANATNINAINDTIEDCIRTNGSKPFKNPQGYDKITITGATWATPIVIKAVSHGRTTGDKGYINGINGNTAANGEWSITVIDKDSFSLDNSIGNGFWTDGGVFYLYPKASEDLATKIFIENKLGYGTPFTIVSGNINSSGNADLFEALVQVAYSTPNMTSNSQSSCTVSAGYYQLFNTSQTYLLNGVSISGTLNLPTTTYINQIVFGTIAISSYYIARSASIKFYLAGVLKYQYDFDPLAKSGVTVTIPTIECDQIERTGGSGSAWQGEGGANTQEGAQFNGYTLSGSGSNTVLRFKVGGSYDNLKLCYANKSIEEIQKLAQISGLSNGTNTILKIKGVNDAVATLNSVTQGAIFPTTPSSGDYFCYTSKGLKTYKYSGSAWVETQYIVLGTAIVAGGIITSITSKLFDQNGYNININTASRKYDSGWFAVAANTTYTKTHNLGTSNIKYTVLVADDASGTNQRPAITFHNSSAGGNGWVGWYPYTTTSSILSLITATIFISYASGGGGMASGYYRILAEVIN